MSSEYEIGEAQDELQRSTPDIKPGLSTTPVNFEQQFTIILF